MNIPKRRTVRTSKKERRWSRTRVGCSEFLYVEGLFSVKAAYLFFCTFCTNHLLFRPIAPAGRRRGDPCVWRTARKERLFLLVVMPVMNRRQRRRLYVLVLMPKIAAAHAESSFPEIFASHIQN